MTYGIIGAMDEEIAYLQSNMSDIKESEIANVTFIEGKLHGKNVVLLKCGIGKVNAAMATTMLIERFTPTAIINTGSAGGFADHLNVGDIVIGTSLVHHDVDVTAFDYEYGQVPQLPPNFQSANTLIEKAKVALDKLNIHYDLGLIATGDSFMSNPERVTYVQKKFPTMLAAEMEGAAIAQVCYQHNIPFIVVRALSDIAGQEASISFEQFLHVAAKNAAQLIEHIVKQ